MKIYLAGNLMVDSSRIFLEKICSNIEEHGFKVFLPHRDAGLLREEDIQDITSRRELFKPIFDLELAELKSSDYAVFVLDGQCFGTTFEMGCAYTLKQELGLDIVIIGLYTDIRGVTSLDFIRICCCDFLVTSEKELLGLIQNINNK
jgi:hypothetical protein